MYSPNVITLIGLCFNIISNVLTNIYAGLSGKEDLPTWVIISCAILYFLYFIFDILDGKHARNTGNSSPLGLLMDHGCDALTTFIFVMALGTILKLDSALYYALIWLMISINFFSCTWEEYHTGILDFPLINGINEGTVIVCSVEIFTAIIGQSFWLNTFSIFDLEFRYNNFIVILFFAFSSIYTLISVIKVLKLQTKSHCKPLSQFITLVILITTIFIVIIMNPDNDYLKLYPKLILFLFGFPFAKLIGHLQLAHLASARFEQYRITILIFLATISLISILSTLNLSYYNSAFNYLILAFIIFNFLSWLHWACFVSGEMCEILDIKRFTVKPKPTQYEHLVEPVPTVIDK